MGFIPKEKAAVRQEAIINWLADPHDKRSGQEVADALGISRQRVHAIKNKDGFMEKVYSRAVNVLGTRLPDILNAMADKAINEKDLKAARFCLEICGKVNGESFQGAGSANQMNINIQNVPRPEDGAINVGGNGAND